MDKRWLAIVFCLAAQAAKGAPPDGGTADVVHARAACREAIRSGRALYASGDFAGAAAAFTRAADLEVYDEALAGSANTELGLAAYRLKDLKRAESATRRALAHLWWDHGAPRAAALFNLGRILEDEGDREGAVMAYSAALELRANPIAHDRLAALDPVAAQPLSVPRPMLGPFRTLRDYCQRPQKNACGIEPIDEETFSCKPDARVKSLPRVSPPYRAVRVLSTRCLFDPGQGWGRTLYHLAIETADGWFVTPTLVETRDNRHCDSQFEVRDLSLRDVVPGPPNEVVLRLQATVSCAGGGSDTNVDEVMTIAGIGPSGRPSATGGMRLLSRGSSETLEGEGESEKEWNLRLRARFLPDGALRITGPSHGLPPRVSELIGTRPLRFP